MRVVECATDELPGLPELPSGPLMRFMVSFSDRGGQGTASACRGVTEAVQRKQAEAAGPARPAGGAGRSSRPDGWQAGDEIAERYRLDRPIGRGACAEVWRAEHVMLEAPAAVKLLSEAIRERTAELERRFLREARATSQLRSPHIVRVFDFGVQEHCAFMAMELLEGETLRQRLDRVGQLSPEETARIISQLAAGLEVAHDAGIVHRDLKPSNIFLAREGDQEVVKIVDFGIAKRTHFEGVDQLATQEGVLIGTPSYASPEQILEASQVDARSDLWQVAVVAFECLCGSRPFRSSSVGQLMLAIVSEQPPAPSTRATVPAGFDGWFARATEAEPSDRFTSARELADALCTVLTPDTARAQWVDARPSYSPPPANPFLATDELPTLPVAEMACCSPTEATAISSSLDLPDLRPRGRRLMVLAVLAGAAMGLFALLSVPSPSPAAQPVREASPAAVTPEPGDAVLPTPGVARDDEQIVPAPASSSVTAEVAPAPVPRPPLPRPSPRARAEEPVVSQSPSRRAEEALGI
ncbi:MAG: serine/threonine protein kinase [Deltaproteobacteria bacterium]|jgi:serine/threonine-protein kinase|nr:serine/threonine protein kinase [Deltaproteobacteria bacterium]MBW2531198.1 serine/threonine protein kinase [Deltaproteobacteria bacterium]